MSINFEEAWKNLSSHDHGHDFEEDGPDGDESQASEHHSFEADDIGSEQIDKNISILFDLKEISKRDEIAKELFEDFLRSLLRYVGMIDRLSLARLDRENSDRLIREKADENRRFAHEAWLANANALSRYCAKLGIDNSWLSVLGSSRTEQTNWALSVISTARKMALNERG